MLIRMLRRAADRARDDRGSAIVNVIVLLAVTSVVAVALSTSVLTSGSATLSSSQRVTAQAAADAGVDYARGKIASADWGCGGWVRAADPAFSVAPPVYRDAGGSVLSACPPGATVASATIVSTGTTASGSVSQQVGAQFEIAPSTASTSEGTGPALFSYSASVLGAGSKVVVPEGLDAMIVLQTGPVTCNGGAEVGSPGTVSIAVQGDLIIGAGCSLTGDAWATGAVQHTGGATVVGGIMGSSLTMGGGSQVGGDIWVSGGVTGSGGIVVGDAPGTGNVTAASLSWSSGARITGSVQTSGLTDLTSATIERDVSAGSIRTSNGEIGGDTWSRSSTTMIGGGAWIRGDATTAAFATDGNGKVGPAGAIAPNAHLAVTGSDPGESLLPPNPPAPSWPLVPSWIDYDFDAHQADWIADGFAIRTMSGPDCGYAGDWSSANKTLQEKIDEFGGGKGVIDARGCTNGVTVSNGTVGLADDLVIIASHFELSNGKIAGPAGTKVWLITPDPVLDAVPSCAAPGARDSFFSGGFDAAPGVLSYMIYSPCDVRVGIGAISGQVFSGSFDLGGYGAVTYAPMGIPGVDLASASTAVPPPAGEIVVEVTARYEIG